jgi:predicted O-methyltransferase YrrM
MTFIRKEEHLMKTIYKRFVPLFFLLSVFLFLPLTAQEITGQKTLDEQVKAFLDEHKSNWHDMNIPMRDGELLYDLIIENHYTSALEIGTSTGHSAIWIAWALSKTGGKLITIEIDERRYQQALENFKEAGLSEYIDARLADAHQLVKDLEGPFDFVFSDADKGWYKQYFIDIAPGMVEGGCFTAHNIRGRGSHSKGIQEFVDYIQSLPNFDTTIEKTRSTGISISYKKTQEE